MNEYQENPFQTPAAPLQEAPPSTTGKPLYRLAAVGLATFIGGPLGGAWIINQDLKRLGQSSGRKAAWLTAIGITLLMMLISGYLPDNTPAIPLNVATAFAMHYYGKHYFGAALDRHAAEGGAFHSNWRAAGIGLLGALVLFVVMAAVTFGLITLTNAQ